MFSPELAEKPYLVVYNKMDLPETSEKWPSFREALRARGFEPFCMSAVTRNGTQEVKNAAYELVRKNAANKDASSKPLLHYLYCLFYLILCLFPLHAMKERKRLISLNFSFNYRFGGESPRFELRG